MDTKQEMSFKEWLARTVCAVVAFLVAMLASVGFAFLGMTAVVPEFENHNLAIGTCAALAVVAAFFGVSPMAQWFNRGIGPLQIGDVYGISQQALRTEEITQ